MERICTTDRGQAALGDHVSDPVRGIGRDMSDQGTAVCAQRVEEPPQGGGVAARRRPHQPAAVVIDHHRQVLVVAFVGNLIDTDPTQIGEPIDALVGVSPNSGHDRPDGAPGDPHQLAHRGFRARHRQPRHRVIERKGVPGVMARPRHRHHRRPMSGAIHPRRIGLQHHLHGAPIQAPPPASALTPVIPGRPAPTPAAAARNPTSWPHPRHHQRGAVSVVLVELDVLDHRALVDTQQPTP